MLEDALNAYYEKFGVNYPLMITSQMTAEEVIEDIRNCIETNTKAEAFDYLKDADY